MGVAPRCPPLCFLGCQAVNQWSVLSCSCKFNLQLIFPIRLVALSPATTIEITCSLRHLRGAKSLSPLCQPTRAGTYLCSTTRRGLAGLGRDHITCRDAARVCVWHSADSRSPLSDKARRRVLAAQRDHSMNVSIASALARGMRAPARWREDTRTSRAVASRKTCRACRAVPGPTTSRIGASLNLESHVSSASSWAKAMSSHLARGLLLVCLAAAPGWRSWACPVWAGGRPGWETKGKRAWCAAGCAGEVVQRSS